MKLSRAEKAEIAARLRDKGYTVRKIAEELGISRTYADGLLKDPDGSKDRARKEKYKGRCEDCGNPTTYKKGGGTARHCKDCAKSHNGNSYWTKELIIDAIKRFAEIHGRRPSSSEWLSVREKHKRLGRNSDERYPYAATVLYHFGSWADAIEAAGFERPMRGQYYLADRSEVARRRGEQQRLRNRQKKEMPTTLESAAATLRKHSPWGVAPASKDPRVYRLYGWALRNGYTWEQLCKEAGVRPRKINPFTSYT